MKRVAPAMTVLAVLAVATACSGASGTEASDRLEGAWRLASGTGPGGDVRSVEGHPITLVLNDGKISGTSACNGYAGSVMTSAGRFSLSEMHYTMARCLPDDVMASEEAYLSALKIVDSIRQDGDQLVLTGLSAELRFDPR